MVPDKEVTLPPGRVTTLIDLLIERPMEITLLVILHLVGGIGFVYTGLAFGIIYEGTFTLYAILGLVFAFANLVVAWGLWTLQKWAYTGAIILAMCLIILAFNQLPFGLIALIGPGITVYYLSRSQIKEIFDVIGFLN